MVVAEMKGAMKDVMEEARSCSGELWQQMASRSVSERMDRFLEVSCRGSSSKGRQQSSWQQWGATEEGEAEKAQLGSKQTKKDMK